MALVMTGGDAVTVALALGAEPVSRGPRACDECAYGHCQFSVRRVRVYLECMQLARRYGEPFEAVLRARYTNSRLIDPLVRGGTPDAHAIRLLGFALEEVERKHGISVANPDNAERAAAALCPERYAEGNDDRAQRTDTKQ